MEGASLSQVLARTGRFAPEAAVQVMLQVLDALARAHALGIVHRDVKPANILLRPDGRVMTTDFGISRIESVGMTQVGTVIGTPSYMSPEQCRGEPVDGRSDIFSAGAVLYELLSGERPFAGRNSTEVTHRVLTETPADLRRKVSGVSEALAAVVDRALAKSPGDRFPSAAAMAGALRRASTGASLPEPNAPEPDATVFAPAAVPGFDEAVLSTIERRLAEHIGPIARHLVRSAARHADSTEAIVTDVSRHIAGSAERDRFTKQALGHVLGGGTESRNAVRRDRPGGAGTRAARADGVCRADRPRAGAACRRAGQDRAGIAPVAGDASGPPVRARRFPWIGTSVASDRFVRRSLAGG